MMSVISRLRDREREGFTLIELLVVVLIIGILAAIAIPTFLGQRKRAQDRSAQSDLRNALMAAKTIYTDGETYGGADKDALGAIEPALKVEALDRGANVNDDDAVVPGTVYVEGVGQVFTAVAASESGAVFAIRDVARDGVDLDAVGEVGTPPAGTYFAELDGTGTIDDALADLNTQGYVGANAGWKSSW